MSFIPNISHDIDCVLTQQELEEIADYTIQKIVSYPKSVYDNLKTSHHPK